MSEVRDGPLCAFFSAEEMSFTVANGNAVSTKRRISELAAETTSSQRPKHLGRVVKHRTSFRLIQMIVAQTNGGAERTWTSFQKSSAIPTHISPTWPWRGFSGAWTVFEQTVLDLP